MARLHCSLANLPDLDLDALASLWSRLFESPPPPNAKRELLVRLLAYGLQAQTHNALSRAAQKSLSAAIETEGKSLASSEAPSSLRLGARLVRSWNGITHEVTVLERGFAYRGQSYRSLSEVAQAITGAHWSGPRFFGLKKLRQKSKPTDRGWA